MALDATAVECDARIVNEHNGESGSVSTSLPDYLPNHAWLHALGSPPRRYLKPCAFLKSLQVP